MVETLGFACKWSLQGQQCKSKWHMELSVESEKVHETYSVKAGSQVQVGFVNGKLDDGRKGNFNPALL